MYNSVTSSHAPTQFFFDTHSSVEELIKSGFDKQQAEGITGVQKRIIESNLATKIDIIEVKRDIEELRNETKKDIELLKNEIKKDIELLRNETKKDIELLRNETKIDIAEIKKDIELLRNETKIDIIELRNETKKDIAELRKDTELLLSKGINRVLIALIAGVGITITSMFAMLKLLEKGGV